MTCTGIQLKLSFTLSPKIEKFLRDLQSQLVLQSLQLQALPAAEKGYMNRCALISNVGTSTRIKHAALTDSEIEWVDTTLIDDGKTTVEELRKQVIPEKLSADRERSIEQSDSTSTLVALLRSDASALFPDIEFQFCPLVIDHSKGGVRGDTHGWSNSCGPVAVEGTGVIYLDMHGDLNTPQTENLRQIHLQLQCVPCSYQRLSSCHGDAAVRDSCKAQLPTVTAFSLSTSIGADEWCDESAQASPG